MAKLGSTGRSAARLGIWLIPIVLVLVLALPKINQGEFSVDTGWYSAIGMQAWREAGRGNAGALWSLPGVGGVGPGGVPYFNKPPLGFWINGLPLWVFGPELWAGRIGSVIGSAACVAAMTWLALAAGRTRREALAAGAATALTGLLLGSARSFSLDVWQAAFLTLALVPCVAAYRRGRPGLLVWSGVGIGLALMVKPMVGLMVVPIVGAWLAWVGRARWISWLAGALLVAIVIGAPWHLSMIAMHGSVFTDQYFGREMIERSAGAASAVAFNRGAESWWYYAGPIAERTSPWVFGAMLAIGMWVRVALSRRREAGNVEARHPAIAWLKLGVMWTVVWVVALSAFADKRPRYLLVLVPVWAWMSAIWVVGGRWRGVEWGAPGWMRRGWSAFLTRWAWIVVPIGAIAIAAAPIRIHQPEGAHWTGLYDVLRSEGAPVYAGAFAPQRAAKVYLTLGWWPRPTTDNAGRRIAEPPEGSVVLYHDRDGLAPGENETVIYQAERLSASRFGSGGWQPRQTQDAGE